MFAIAMKANQSTLKSYARHYVCLTQALANSPSLGVLEVVEESFFSLRNSLHWWVDTHIAQHFYFLIPWIMVQTVQ